MRTQHFFKTISFLAFLLFVTTALFASHNRSGEILYKRLPPFTNSNYTYSITVIRYTGDGNGIADRCADTVYFGDGTKGVAFRINGLAGGCCPSTSSCGALISSDANYMVKMNVYSIVHTYPGPGSYVIHSADPNRSQGINNIPNSGNQEFYIESVMNLTPNMGANTSPALSRLPIDRGVTNLCFYHNACAYDIDGDSLAYELISCKGTGGQAAPGYSFPPVNTGGSFSIDAVTGLVSWCYPKMQGTFQIAFLVKEYRKFGCPGTYQQLGYIERDMEIIIASPFSTFTLSTTGFRDTCIIAGSVLTKTIIATINPSSIIVEKRLYGYMMAPENQPPSVLNPPVLGFPSGVNSAVSWTSNCNYIQRLPQTMYVAHTMPGYPVSSTHYPQFRVKVLPPPPKITSVQVATSKVTLQWQGPTACSGNITGYNVYRKFGTNSWSHAPCETGVPLSSGFALIGSTPSTVTSFEDNDLWTIPNGSLGNYLVTVLMGDCAESYADSAKAVTLVVGLNEEHLNSSVQIFPNPSSTKFTVKVQQAGSVDFICTLFNIEGKLLKEENNLPGNQELIVDGSDLASGVYVLRIKTQKGTVYRKLIKEQ